MLNSFGKIIEKEGITKAEVSRESELSQNTIAKLSNDYTSVRSVTVSKAINAVNRLLGVQKYSTEDLSSL